MDIILAILIVVYATTGKNEKLLTVMKWVATVYLLVAGLVLAAALLMALIEVY